MSKNNRKIMNTNEKVTLTQLTKGGKLTSVLKYHKILTLFLICTIFISLNLVITKKAIAQVKSNITNNLTTKNSSKTVDQYTEKYSTSKYKTEVRFEPNKGQTDKEVKILGRGLGYELFLSANNMTMVFQNKETAVKNRLLKKTKEHDLKSKSSVLRLNFIGANKNPKISFQEELKSKQNYLFKEKQITNVPNYKKATYENLYDGINAVFYSNDQSLEYDLNVAPNVDVAKIKIGFDGADNLKINKKGDLILKVGNKEIKYLKPKIYQYHAEKKTIIKGSYLIDKKGNIGFDIKSYDKAKTLIIDPILIYSTYLGGIGNDSVTGITADNKGNSYVTGLTTSSNFPKTVGSSSTPSDTNFQVFLTKYTPTGKIVFSTYWGGSDRDYAIDVSVDDSENIFVAGLTRSTNYPTTTGAYQTTLQGGDDGFISKLNPAGTTFIYSTYLGGTANDTINAASLDNSGNFFLAGTTTSANYPTTTGVVQPTHANGGGRDSFITKLDTSGNSLVYSTFLGGTGTEECNDIAIDSSGNAIITGYTESNDFPVTKNVFQSGFNGLQDGFISKVNSLGTSLISSTYIGNAGGDLLTGVDVDSDGNIYVTGDSVASVPTSAYPTTSGAFQETSAGQKDIVVTKINPTLTSLLYSTFLGGSGSETSRRIVVNAIGEVAVIGNTQSLNFPTTTGAFQNLRDGNSDAIITKFKDDGSALIYSTYLGGNGDEIGVDIYTVECGDMYITGGTQSTDFPTRDPQQAINNTTAPFALDSFITKLGFVSTDGISTDASSDGSFTPHTIKEYKLPASVDTDVFDLTVNYGTGPKQLKVELWASLYRPTTLTGSHPVIVIEHGNHQVCERNSMPIDPMNPPPAPLSTTTIWYGLTGTCDFETTPTFDEAPFYDVIQNHRGYDYLGQKLASWGYIVVSLNVTRGIHIGNHPAANHPDEFIILPRGRIVLRHLQKLKEWNDCTTDPACQTPSTLDVDLRGKIDFSNIGLLGHSRGGQGVRAAYNIYKASSTWQSRISGANFKGVFEIAPTDKETNAGIIPQPLSKFIIDGTKWNVLLPMCDGDVWNLQGMHSYDRMLLGVTDSTPSQKSTYTVRGANHNFYNTVWTSSEKAECLNHTSIFGTGSGSEEQKKTGIASVLAFFRANIGNSTTPTLNQNFNPRFDIPASVEKITRIDRNFTPSPAPSETTVFEDFKLASGMSCSSGSNTCVVVGGANVNYLITKILDYHDESLNVLSFNWLESTTDKNLQIYWRPANMGEDISDHDTFDFRISRNSNSPNDSDVTNFSLQLVMANEDLSDPVKVCNYIKLDKSIGGDGSAGGGTLENRNILQTVRIPLTAFNNADLSSIRGIKIKFDESKVGSIFLANLRFTK